MSHCCLHPGSVFVTKAGDWKLGGLCLIGPSADLKYYEAARLQVLPSRYQSPEVARSDHSVFTGASIWSLDSWCLGCLIYEVFNGIIDRPQSLTNTASIPPSIIPGYRKLLATAPDNRCNPKQLLTVAYFTAPIVQLVDFLDNLALKSASEKEEFFKSLEANLKDIPDACAKYKVIPLLTQALEFGAGTNPRVLISLIQLGSKLEEEEYKQTVIPCLIRMFSSNDRAIRAHLLKVWLSVVSYFRRRW
jgi:SCY1-like protein 1